MSGGHGRVRRIERMGGVAGQPAAAQAFGGQGREPRIVLDDQQPHITS